MRRARAERPTPSWFGGHRGVLAAVVAALAVGLVMVGVALRGAAGPPAPPESTVAAASPSETGPSPTTSSPTGSSPAASPPAAQPAVDFGPVLERSVPVAVRIPAIHVSARPLVELSLDAAGRLEAPTDFDHVGWYVDGPTPGELGPAVLAGHVDSTSGPAVFYRLGQLKAGQYVFVTRADGREAKFVVDKVARYPKRSFPTSVVYASASHRAELRLVTCGGDFNHRTGHYLDNVVVFAHLVG